MDVLKDFFSQPTNVYTSAIVAVLIAAYFIFAPKDEEVTQKKTKVTGTSAPSTQQPRKSSRVAGDSAPDVATSPEPRGRTGTRSNTPKRSASKSKPRSKSKTPAKKTP